MRWQHLFADLQAQFEEHEAALDRAEASSRARAEVGALLLLDRLRGSRGRPVALRCRGAGDVVGVLSDVGPDWLLLAEDSGREVLVARDAVVLVGGLDRSTAAPEESGVVGARWDLRRALRALVRDRSTVQVVLDDGTHLSGTLDRVGADYVELAEHPLDRPRRAEAVQAVRAVVIGAVAVVRTVLPGGE
jgi:hypothetical protein